MTRKRLSIIAATAVTTSLIAGSALGSAVASAASLTGAGSTLVAPLEGAWAIDFERRYGESVTYAAVGSGAGIAQITARTVDFGASDAPLTPSQAAACNRCIQIPWALGAVGISYNIPGVRNLRLTGPVIANIYLGKITNWNDPAIAKLNPGASLPATKIRPVYRSDSSGDTYAFSDFLAKVSPEWKSKAGVSTQVSFPVGIGGKGNDGVAAAIGGTDGALGYLAISYVFANKLDYALVENAAGNFPVPGSDSIGAAAAAVSTIPRDNAISLTNPPPSAPKAYPISTFTYALVPQRSSKAKTLRDFLTYALGPGQKFGAKLQFEPLPARVVDAGRTTIARIGSS